MRSAFIAALTAAVPAKVRQLTRTLADAGHHSWIVGGSVRDVLLDVQAGRAPRPQGDWDLASDARPEQVQKLFKKVLPTGIQHGTVTVVLGGEHYELTTLRGERGFSDGRHPDEVFFVSELREDLARRDFTVNALAFDVDAAELHDPFDGIADLERGLLRAVGEPLQRFSEDGLRVLRGARFCSTLGMRLEEETRAALRPSLDSFRKVSLERVRDEWWKALQSPLPSACFRVQLDEGLLEVTAPELCGTSESPSGLLEALPLLDRAAADPLRRLALLCARGFPGDPSSQAAGTEALGLHLRLSNAQRERLVRLVQNHALGAGDDGPTVRRWLARVGRTTAEDVLDFHVECTLDRPTLQRSTFIAQARAELGSGAALGPTELALSGRDLLAARLLAPGPAVGRVLAQLLERVLDEPALNERGRLLELATELSRV